ncbi:hypothetical protein cgR_0729 [Corynebacterium glutamicum R]|uniref:Uncharacterized protein n=1 Tax=Corynebacterium glutamicum (strain R) TaxID=340322 RepID=A0AB72V8J5_CORGB|nr:hypothetical protein cgR_0729 [Corynebacterium glutamicum R]
MPFRLQPRRHARTTNYTSMVIATSVPSPISDLMRTFPPARSTRPWTDSASPWCPSGMLSGSNPAPRSRTKMFSSPSMISAYTSAVFHAGMLGHVHECFADCHHRCLRFLSQRFIGSHGHRHDTQRINVLDFTASALQRSKDSAGCLRCFILGIKQPLTQLAFLPSGQAGDFGGVVGTLLNQRQGLQYRIMQAGSNICALSSCGFFRALLAQLIPHPHPQRNAQRSHTHQREHHGHQRHDEAVLGAPIHHDQHDRHHHQHTAGGNNQQIRAGFHPAVIRQPHHQQAHTDYADGHQRAHREAGAQHHRRRSTTDSEQHQAPRHPALACRRLPTPLFLNARKNPNQGIRKKTRTAQQRRKNQQRTNPKHRHIKMLCQPRCDTRNNPTIS